MGLRPHWRAVAWACGAWLAGRHVLLGTGEEVEAAGLTPELSVAFSPQDLCPAAEAQVLLPSASLALRWSGELPPLVLDGAADLMTYPDRFTPVSVSADQPCLTDLGPVGAPSESRAEASAGALTGTLTRAGLVARIDEAFLGAAASSGLRAALVRRARTAEALQDVLVAWRAGQTAVVLTPEAGEDVAARAMRQEGISGVRDD